MSIPHDLTPFILEQLEKAGVHSSPADGNEENIKAYCFNGHDTKTPSLSIHRLDGRFYCFGCGAKGHHWDAIANYIQVDTLDDDSAPDPFAVLKHNLKKHHRDAVDNVELPWGIRPWTDGPWRRIRPEVLDGIGTYAWFDDDPKIRAERILFPISMYKKIKGWVARRLDKALPGEKLLMPYRNDTNMKSTEVLFPLDYVMSMEPDTIVLVEGPYDALRLVNYDIPALAIMGTNNYRPGNRVHLLNAGAERVIVAMDADKGGEGVRYDIARSMRSMFDVEHFMCPDGQDPGSMEKQHLDRLWNRVWS